MDTQNPKTRKRRSCPPNELGEPQKRFADTFHAVELMRKRYFSGVTAPGSMQAEADPGDNVTIAALPNPR